MKKVLIGLLIACLTFSFVACEMDTIQKIGTTMGSFGNNVYGIKPNMDQVNAATSIIKDNAKVEDGVAVINLEEIAALASDIQDMKDSPAKKEAIKEEMKKPVVEEGGNAIKEKLEAEVEGKKNALEDVVAQLSSAPAEVTSLLSTVASNLEGLTVSDNPTKGELLTVALVANLADVVKDQAEVLATGTEEEKAEAGIALVDEALKTLDAINTINEEFDLLAGIDIAALLSGLDGGEKALGDMDDDEQQMIMAFAEGLFDAIGRNEDGSLNKENFKRFAFDQIAKRTAYEAGALGLARYEFTQLFDEDGQVNPDAFLFDKTLAEKYVAKDYFTINDVIAYLISYIFTDIYTVGEIMQSYGGYSLYDCLNAYASEDEEKIEAITQFYKQHYEDVIGKIITCFGDESLENMNKGFARVNTMLNTVLTLIIEADYKNLYMQYETDIVQGATNFMNNLLKRN